ncbi:hypothetical protein GGI15_002185 [Coemansia interrupta]|uniref:SHSP domain-containing protein n=1 Tax=Coemansia interrupta TaxID=1126814 RepID=A0A9W8HGI3_9FUNG|nr:hypothetical protein GGI15_002185 [Coemansia interrupta]
MSAFHNDIFNRRASASTAFFNDFRQDNRSGVFAAPVMPKPMFAQGDGHARRSSTGGMGHQHFAYVAGCEICEDYVRRGHEICRHEHRVVCRGVHHGCCCHHCCTQRESSSSSASTAVHACHEGSGYRARTEESTTDSAFANGRVRARSATTTVGDASFGFANMESEMMRMRQEQGAGFFQRPFDSRCVEPPAGHVRLAEGNVNRVFDHHAQMHGARQQDMRMEAADHFAGHSRPRPLFGAAYGCDREQEETKVKTTTTTTTTTTTRRFEEPPACVPPPVCVAKPEPPVCVAKPEPPVCLKPVPPPPHHTVIPVGTRPDVLVKRAEPCCTWCKFLPCLSCPKPTNPNARFNKANFRLFPEYEFLPDTLAMPRPTEYFPRHTHVASRTDYKVEIPRVMDSAQRIYVDFIGDQMVIMGEHGKPLHVGAGVPRHMRSSPSVRSTRSSLSSRETAHVHGFVPEPGHHLHHNNHPQHHLDTEKGHHLPVGVSRVFAKNFFLPRDTYDRNRAQAFIKPNGKLKIIVPVLEN